MPLFRTQSAAEKTSLAPHDSKARLLSDHDSQGFMAKPCTPHPHCAARAALQAANPQWRGQRAGPLAFSWGSKGDILSRERISPLSAAPHGVGKSRSLFGLPPLRARAEKKRTSLSRSPLFLLSCNADRIILLPASPLRQRQPSPVRRRNTARSARSASRTSRGTGSWSAGQWRSSSALPRGTRPR